MAKSKALPESITRAGKKYHQYGALGGDPGKHWLVPTLRKRGYKVITVKRGTSLWGIYTSPRYVS